MPLNDSNFLMWFGPAESPTIPALPHPFVREPHVMSPVVWLVPGDETAFYINSVDNSALGGELAILHEHTGLQRHVPPHSIRVIDFPNGQHSYGQFTMPSLGPGFARLVLGNYKSQWLWVSAPEEAARVTATVSFNNGGRRLQNIRYGYLPANFVQQFRIRLAVETEESAHSKEVYTESDTGKRRHLYSEPGWIVGFQTPEYDRWGHRAMASLIEHDTILINNKPFTYQSAYKSNSNAGDALTTGSFELREENYSTLHRA